MPLASSVCRCESSRLRQAKRTSKRSAILGRLRIRSRAAPPLTLIAALTTSSRPPCSLTEPRLGRHDKGLRSFNSRAVCLSHTHGRRGCANPRRVSRQHRRCVWSNCWVVDWTPTRSGNTISQRGRATEPSSHRQPLWIRTQHADGRGCYASPHSRSIQRFHKLFRMAHWSVTITLDNLRFGLQVALANRRVISFFASIRLCQ